MTTPNSAMRARYLNDSITTASPARLLVMLYDRLVLDLKRGEEAYRAGERGLGTEAVQHAQEIVFELRSSLKPGVWDGSAKLDSLYGFLVTELTGALIKVDADRVAGCRALVEPLRDAWREAALADAAPAAPRGTA